MSGEESQKYVQACNKSAEACNNCAEKMKEEGCAKQCRTNAELANCTSKLISLNSPQAPKLAELTVESAKLCASMCGKREEDHCKACTEAARHLYETLGEYQNHVKA